MYYNIGPFSVSDILVGLSRQESGDYSQFSSRDGEIKHALLFEDMMKSFAYLIPGFSSLYELISF